MPRLIERKVTNSARISNYKSLTPAAYRAIVMQARALRGKTVLHINATPQGGGVAELLASQVSLERSLGLNSRWYYMDAPPAFFQVTKKIHNLSQGMPGRLVFKEQDIYLETNSQMAGSFQKILDTLKPNVIVVHDPQPMALVKHVPDNIRTILRMHTDLSEANPRVVKFLKSFMEKFDRIIVSSQNFKSALPTSVRGKARVIMPAIDPLTEKNRPMKLAQAQKIIRQLGIDPQRPLFTQVSRFDPWKDPLGVISAYTMAKQEIPELQLALAGLITAQDDPEAYGVLEQVCKQAGADPDIHIFSDTRQLGRIPIDKFVNAILTASTAVFQKSIKEGFGLTVTEAMWKGKAVIGGNAHGIRAQITNRKNGLIVKDELQAARAIIELMKKPKLRTKLGQAARVSVRKKFLLPRFLLENLQSYK